MRTPIRAIALALTAVMAIAAHPADTAGYHLDDAERDIFFAQQDRWLSVAGTTGIDNVDHQQDETASWDDTAPDGPVGGVVVASAVSGFADIADPEAGKDGQMRAIGQATGYLDTMVLDLYWLDPSETAMKCGMDLALQVEVDGIPVINMAGVGNSIPVFTEVDGNGFVSRVKLTNVFAQLESYGTQYVGTEDQVHTVDVTAIQFPLCQEAVWMYDSASAPTSIRFNIESSDPSVSDHTVIDALNPPQPDPAA